MPWINHKTFQTKDTFLTLPGTKLHLYKAKHQQYRRMLYLDETNLTHHNRRPPGAAGACPFPGAHHVRPEAAAHRAAGEARLSGEAGAARASAARTKQDRDEGDMIANGSHT